MEPNRVRAKSWIITRAALERFLITQGEPDDIVVTGISPKINHQEAWQMTANSKYYPAYRDTDMIDVEGKLDFTNNPLAIKEDIGKRVMDWLSTKDRLAAYYSSQIDYRGELFELQIKPIILGENNA